MNSSLVYAKLKEMGIEIVEPPKPGGSYSSVNIRGNIAYVAIQFPKKADQFYFTGRLGKELNLKEGYKAASLTANNVLMQIGKYVGFDSIAGLNHLDIYYQAYGPWDEAPQMADGASNLLTQVLGSQGNHSRSLVGVERLPKNFCIGIVSSFTLVKKTDG